MIVRQPLVCEYEASYSGEGLFYSLQISALELLMTQCLLNELVFMGGLNVCI